MTWTIRSSAMPASRQKPRARSVRSRVRVDGHDRPVGRLAEGQPQRRVAVGRPDLDDPPPAGGERRQDPPGVAVDDRDAERLGGGLDGGGGRRDRRGDRLDPVEVVAVRDPVAIVLHGSMPPSQTSRPAPKYRPAARIVPAAIVPTLMYSSPVADSMLRVRAVWTAAHETTSGKTARR